MKDRLKYLFLETFLIFLGVMGAFWVDRYKESIQSEKIRLEIYKRLQQDMFKDSTDFVKIKQGIVIQKERIRNVFQWIKDGEITDTLLMTLFRIETEFYDGDQYRFRDNTDTYVSIVNGESWEIFELDTTFGYIRDYYVKRKAFVDAMQGYRTYSALTLTPFFDKHFDRSSVSYVSDENDNLIVGTLPDIKIDDFKTKEFTNILIRLRELLMFIPAIDHYSKICQKNLLRIKKELKD